MPQARHLCSGFQLFSKFFFPSTFILQFARNNQRNTDIAIERERERECAKESQKARLVIEFAKFSWLGKLVWSFIFNLVSFLLPLEAQIVANYIWRCLKNVIWYAQIFNMNSAVQSSIARARVIVRARDRHIYREMEMNDSLLEYHGKFKWQAKYSYHEFTEILFGECCINYLWDFYHFVSRIQFRFLSHAIYMLLSILTSWLMSLAGDTQLSSITGQGSSSFCCASL